MITIGTVKFDFQTGNQEFAQSLYGRWDRFFRTSFEAVAEEVMSHYDRADETLMIDSLPVELPVLPEGDFDEAFPRHLREALHDYFRRLMAAGSGSAALAGVRRVPVGQNVLDVLCFFLLHGYLPASATRAQNNIKNLLEQVLQMAPDEFRQFLECHAHCDFLYKRLVYQFDDRQLEAIVNKLYASHAPFIHRYTRAHTPAMDDFRKLKWEFILSCLLVGEKVPFFHRKYFVQAVIRQLAAHYNQQVAGLLEYFHEEFIIGGTASPYAGLAQILGELHRETLRPAPDALSVAQPGKETAEQWIPANRVRDDIHIKPITETMYVHLQEKENLEEPIWINNAGVVLFYPFYSRLFRMLNLTEDKDPYRLKNEEAQLHAIFLLQYVVYGKRRDSFEEQELIFNKILVNWEGGPLPRKYALTDEDKKTVENMITGGRTHWEKLKGTMNNTLRQAFFERPGAIRPSNVESIVVLEVEEKAYDILLDHLPWSIDMQRLFNSDKRLKVKWR